MKKGLSILLVTAALFGFYGSAVNLNDILACKDYWEEAGEKSTADMNKLEDGLNQLKENEQAYLDGKDQLAEGEQALADGEAQYAKGLADYEAAPGKLAAGERKLAAGEKELAEGKESYSKLKTLISGLNKAKKHGVSKTKNHDKYWHDAFSNALKPGRQLIVKTLNDKKDMVAMLEKLTGASDLVSKASNANSYPAFDSVVNKQLQPTFAAAATALNNFADLAEGKATSLQNALNAYNGLTAAATADTPGLESIWSAPIIPTEAGNKSFQNLFGDCNAKAEYEAVSMKGSPYAALKPAFDQLGMHKHAYAGAAKASVLLRGGVASQLSDFLDEYGETLEGVAASNADFAQLLGAIKALAVEGGADDGTFSTYMPAVINGLNEKAAPTLRTYAQTAQDSADQFAQWHEGYETLAHGKDGKVSSDYPEDLASTSSGIPYAFKNIVTNPTTKAAVKKYDKKLLKILKKYSGDKLKNDSMEEFDEDIVYLSEKIIPRAQKVLAKVKSSANKQLASGRKQLAAGRKQLAQGRADYAAAPGKLADAEQQLADGRQQLADGKAQLAQYEDGEQQIRDGLATLVGTEPDLSLESISDRLNGDTDFDNGDEHLDIDEGLAAVDVGRGYQAEDGVLITDEIMARAVGTGALLGAGALALIAAILSFLKKNKGAGVFAILAAAAGAFGAYYGTNAGTYFSDIAGSTAGNAAWMAAGILGVVALVHAIVHFTAKKEA